MLNCEYTDPKQADKIGDIFIIGPLRDKDKSWNYSKMNCSGDIGTSSGANYEQITDPTTGKTFFLDKTISYGSALTSFFVLCLIIIFISHLVFKIVLKRN